jgi:hypothetical protein
MDAVWWLLVAVSVVWHLRQSVRNWRTASRLIDDDVAAFNCEHGRAVAVLATQPLALFLVLPHLNMAERCGVGVGRGGTGPSSRTRC